MIQQLWLKIAIYVATVMCVAIALKVLNNVRIEMKLEEQERLLLQARMEALQSQINPHFLFNTLEHGFLARALQSGQGARGDCQAFEHSAAIAAQERFLCSTEG